MKEEEIHALGIWLVRLALVCGAIYCGIIGKNEIAGTCGSLVVISFLFF